MTIPRLSAAQLRCLVELDRRRQDGRSAWARPCRSSETIRVLSRRGFVETRSTFPGGQLEARITAAGITAAAGKR